MKKHKIIDAVFFYDELDMLTFRLTELNEYVDQFIVMESGVDFMGNSKPLIFKQNEHLFEKWKDKISYLSFNELSSSELKILSNVVKKNTIPIVDFVEETNRTNIQLHLLTLLRDSLLSSDLYMEDIIMISDIDEIPDLSKFSEIIDKIGFSPVILRQKNFIWSTKFISTNPNLGTTCHQFTSLITNTSVFLSSYFKKDLTNLGGFEIVDSGYHFSHFYNFDKTVNKLKLINPSVPSHVIENSWNNLVSIPINEDSDVYHLIEYDGELPKNIKLLSNQPIGREESKKHFVAINSNIEVSEKYFEQFGDSIYLINFVNDPQISFKVKLSDKITQYNILIPNSKYYDILIEENTFENFQKMFGVNEIKKIISLGHPLNKDLFFFFNGEKPGTLLGISWGELKDGFIYDKISEIL
jgi:beta-1,4-mannosyl-glycoprotein beta-1,4-N-acetylglucosaminyltransferase